MHKETSPRRLGSWIKWIALIGTGFVVAVCLGVAGGVWYFSPLIKLSNQLGKWRLGSIELSEQPNLVDVKGQQDLRETDVTRIKIPFQTAKLDVSASDDSILKWDCKARTAQVLRTQILGQALTLNLGALNFARCSLILPRGLASEFRGVNGHMEIHSIHSQMDISLTNGKVNLRPDRDKVYDFDVNVKNGLQDFFPRSAGPEAIRVRVNVVNGLVNKD